MQRWSATGGARECGQPLVLATTFSSVLVLLVVVSRCHGRCSGKVRGCTEINPDGKLPWECLIVSWDDGSSLSNVNPWEVQWGKGERKVKYVRGPYKKRKLNP